MIKALTICGVGLYGGVVRDLKDPSRKTVSGKRFDLIKSFFLCLLCGLVVAVVVFIVLQAGCLPLRRRGRFWRFWECHGRSLTNVCGRILYKRAV